MGRIIILEYAGLSNLQTFFFLILSEKRLQRSHILTFLKDYALICNMMQYFD